MKCPFCHADNDRVIDSRAGNDGYAIRRRRECASCKRRYTTYEHLDGQSTIKVVKKDNVREPFNREKIRLGLERACWKRPISDEHIETIVSQVEGEVYADFRGEITSRRLGEMVMMQLEQLDHVAYVRFASVYREFKDVRDFVQELQPILDREKKAAGR